jgi:hypothetical protein
MDKAQMLVDVTDQQLTALRTTVPAHFASSNNDIMVSLKATHTAHHHPPGCSGDPANARSEL